MKRFTNNMIKTNMIGKGLNACVEYLQAVGISNYEIERNAKGCPILLRFMLEGTKFAGYCKAVAFDKRTGLCDWWG